MTTGHDHQRDLRCSQLFLDDTWIEDNSHVGRVWHQASKYPEPVLTADMPWEYPCPVLFGTILRWHERYCMWYCAWTRHIPPRVCYAESTDGLHWDKPELGLYEFAGSTGNNIILQSGSSAGLIDDISVMEDPDDGVWPLKALYWDSMGRRALGEHGIFAARSKEGIVWEPLGRVLPEWGDRFNAVSRRIDGRFVVYGRAPGGYRLGPVDKRRVVAYAESEDLRQWTDPALMLAPDTDDPPLMQFYSATAFPYEGQILGSIERMHMIPDRLDTEIIWSRDGKAWKRSAHRPRFIEWGQPGSFDNAWINLPTNGPIVQETSPWFYYSGRSGAHGAPYPLNHGAIGLATLRIDGFCSLQAAETPAAVLTKPLIWVDGEILVNVDPRRDISGHPTNVACGTLRVEIRDAENHPLPGFTLEDSVPIEENTASLHRASAVVRWKNGKSARELRGRKIRLFFLMRDAHLYSFHAGEV